MSIVYVNSTIPARREMYSDGEISPIHFWGYEPQPDDLVYYHPRTRIQIHLRARIDGFDIPIFFKVLRDFIRGHRKLYLVTKPDLRLALALYKWLFPDLLIVSWSTTAEESRRYYRQWLACAHVICETQPALDELLALGFPAERASLQLWGADPAFYARTNPPAPSIDVLFFGLIGRDVALVRRALAQGPFEVATTTATVAALKLDGLLNIRLIQAPRSYAATVDLIHSARVAWIPVSADVMYPNGATNLIESLLCGTAVVLADTSKIPLEAHRLPGVFIYKNGDTESFLEATELALRTSRQDPNFRELIRDAARPVLDGRKLEHVIRTSLKGGDKKVPSGMETSAERHASSAP